MIYILFYVLIIITRNVGPLGEYSETTLLIRGPKTEAKPTSYSVM